MLTHISVRGAREHNLKNLDIDIQRETLAVITARQRDRHSPQRQVKLGPPGAG